MIHHTTPLLLISLMLTYACGGDSQAGAKAKLDAAADVACEMPEGFTYLVTDFRVAPVEDGFDLDGDGEPNNQVGKLPNAALSAAAEAWSNTIVTGEWLIGFHIEGWDAPRTANDSDLFSHWFMLGDADDLASNNMSGGAFLVDDAFLDLNCNSTTLTKSVLTDGVLRGNRPVFDFPLTTGTGSLYLIDMELEVIFDASFDKATARFGGNMTLCSMASIPLQLNDDFTGSVLDFIINDAESIATVPIDVDIDGDGLEQVIGNGISVLHCIDGDGTVIEGSDCPCHPAMADAYSLAFAFKFLRVPVLGFQ